MFSLSVSRECRNEWTIFILIRGGIHPTSPKKTSFIPKSPVNNIHPPRSTRLNALSHDEARLTMRESNL